MERANQEVLRHLNAILFDSRFHDKWSFEQLPMVQRIMNTVEKTSTGVTPAELILSVSRGGYSPHPPPQGPQAKQPYPSLWMPG